MAKSIAPAELYTFMKYCNKSGLPKMVLDCGAGGNFPTLAMFYENGYETLGIEYSDKQILKAEKFCADHGYDLNISKGDMRSINIGDRSISFVYSYNSIFHMPKRDIEKSVNEIERVLSRGGLCFLNFLSVDDCGFGDGEELGKGEFVQREYGGEVLHSYFGDDEADGYFADFNILRKEKRVVEEYEEGQKCRFAFLDYIIEKL